MARQSDSSGTDDYLSNGLGGFAIGAHIAIAETKNRYARSMIGPIWITIQTALFVIVVGTVVAQVFRQDFGLFFSWFSISYVMWVFLSGMILDASQQFTSAAGLIKDRGVEPRALYFLSIARQTILMAHMLIVPIVIILFFQSVNFVNVILAIPGLLLFSAFCVFLCPLIAVVSVKYRDARPILESFMQIMFLISPVLWPTAVFESRAPLALSVNPISHLMAIWREPLFRGHMPWDSFLIVGLLTALLALGFGRIHDRARRISVWL